MLKLSSSAPDHTTMSRRSRNLSVGLRRRGWQKACGYHQQARGENGFFRYKRLIGGRLRAIDLAAQMAEVTVACDILNTMTEKPADRYLCLERTNPLEGGKR